MAIGWIDPSIETGNGGDLIIAQAVGGELRELVPSGEIHPLPSRRPWTREERKLAQGCDLFVVGGTNLLTSHPHKYRQWEYGLRDAVLLRHRCILFGVGWWQYQDPPDVLARAMLRSALLPGVEHGARDSYTVGQLQHSGIEAVNISCPTLWDAPPSGTTRNQFRGPVVATLTDYMRDPERDEHLLKALRARTDELHVWPQGSEDVDYVTELGFAGQLVDSDLSTFDDLLANPGMEYVGTRLHAGIRALAAGVPAVVVAIDNRAAEIARDVQLWSIARTDLNGLDRYLDELSSWGLVLPTDAIATFRRDLATAINQSTGTVRP